MATEEDLEKAESEAAEESDADADPSDERSASAALPRTETALATTSKTDDEIAAEEAIDAAPDAPVQLGYQRFVYAAYLAGAMIVGFLFAKIGHAAWYRLGQWKPVLGEPKDELIYPVAGIVGVVVALYYWRKPEARGYANEVAEELSRVTWPTRKEVTNSTTVVVLTTIFATVFFALMDQFWKYVTDKIYSF